MSVNNKRAPWINWALFFGTLVIVFFLGLLASSIIERKAESEYVYKPKVNLSEYEPRNELWGENFPREYQSYLKTADTGFRSKFNGNAMEDALARDPRMVVLWAGYAFSKDYSTPRGHYYAITDVRSTLRTGTPKGPDDGPQPATCWTCKSPDVPRLMEKMGAKEFYKGKWAAKGPEVVNYIGCADCHDPKTMDLRITRPALIEAFQAMGKDISKASHQEMRSLVCAQCHVEYYFDKKRPDAPEIAYLTFPWKNGMNADSALAYYNGLGFTDFTHQLSRTPILKAQHPDYELYLTGIHADRGVACADCHMPYVKEGGQKFTSHKITSPLDNISGTCQVCHRESEEALRENVYERQEKVKEIRDRAETELVRAHVEAKAAWDAGATEPEMAPVLQHIRNGQWYWDYSAASHGAAFHSPIEVSRIIGNSISEAKEARILLARILMKLGKNPDVPYPDIATKDKAQQYIGLEMAKLKAEKAEWIKTVLPGWDQQAKARQDAWPVQKEDKD
ncbi:MAG TPA: ammonia-forming cytochrome c nitrite reductase [Bacteroidales bacterium]|nr:ammonia-forming cytochrome c nitrite reductase [Bacteroidales bacterium]HPS61542.1 ammonia-forming cytochrome c nitrite reductase [Bacteroidales bacterium]